MTFPFDGLSVTTRTKVVQLALGMAVLNFQKLLVTAPKWEMVSVKGGVAFAVWVCTAAGRERGHEECAHPCPGACGGNHDAPEHRWTREETGLGNSSLYG